MYEQFVSESIRHWFLFWITCYCICDIICQILTNYLMRYHTGPPPQTDNLSYSRIYSYLWNFTTRVLSTAHATIVVYRCICLYLDYGLYPLTDYGFHILHPEGMKLVITINAIMMTYLTIDASFMLWKRTEKKMHLSVIHHVIGALSMYQFLLIEKLQFNSLYFAFTEISTIPLNLCWMMIKLNLDKDGQYKILFLQMAIATIISYFIIRILGSVYLMFLLLSNLDQLLYLPLTPQLFLLFGNTAVTALNLVWFSRLVSAWR